MNERAKASACQRQDDLIAYLYGESTEHESREFGQHLRECPDCRAEMTSFSTLRESILTWKHEALTGFGSPNYAITTPALQRKSAAVALREFFSWSPLWMKGAVALVSVVFVMLAVISVGHLRSAERPPFSSKHEPDAIYTREDLDRAVKQAIDERSTQEKVSEPRPEEAVLVPRRPTRQSNRPVVRSVPALGSRRPLSKAERQQLAADLRLTSTRDENGVELLVDRIND